jgi:predicted porin
MEMTVNWMRKLVVAAAALCTLLVAPARALEVAAGSWNFSFTGNVNAFATYQVCGVSNSAITGVPLACNRTRDAPNQFSIESGLLPNALVFTAKTRQFDVDTAATVGVYPGLHVSDTRTGVGSTEFSADVRQAFLTFGDKSWGTVKLGKDLGLFGSDAILSDMTLLGVGAGAGQRLNHNVTIGHIGSGYIYADWIPQFAYATPSFGAAQLTVAVVEAFRIAPADSNAAPGVQAKLTYDLPASGRVWVGGMYQSSQQSAPPTNPSLNTVAGEAGVKVYLGGLGALAYGYIGDGLGTTLIGLDATPGTITGDSIDKRRSFGFFGQLTYKIPDSRLRPGVSYGKSYVDLASGESNPGFLKSNEVITGALFYAVTDALTLTAEYDHTRAKSQGGGLAKSNSAALGGIIFF